MVESSHNPIDIVLTWVDGNDPAWLTEKARHHPRNCLMNGMDRFRDWDNLQYLFRGIEKFCPWVNRIFFVTWGHLPAWLNRANPKLTVVRHEEFLEKKNLPVFNSHPIEINFHRIPGLAEQFIYFNDDCFLLQPMRPQHFFRDGLPVNVALSNIMHEGVIAPIVLNNLELINKNFNRHKGERLTKRGIILKNWWKWFYPRYGLRMLDTLLLLRWKTFSGFVNYHQPQPFLKSTYEEVWEKEPEVMERVSGSKFRDNMDVSQYLFRYWQFASGKFYPDSVKNAFMRRRYVELRTVGQVESAAQEIESNRFQMICLNDSMSKGRFTERDVTTEEFNYCKKRIKRALHSILPVPCSFELQ